MKTSEYKKAMLILNPVAGRRGAFRCMDEIIRVFMDSGFFVTTLVTARRGEAEELAREHAGEFDLLVCAGGDGTLHEVICGLAEGDIHIPLGYIPCGTTNDFAHSHGLPTEPLSAAKAIAGGAAVDYDIGRFGNTYFASTAVFGAFSWIGYTTDQNTKNLFGLAAYVVDGVRDLSRIKPIPMRLTLDGVVHEDEYLFGSVSNAPSVGGIITLLPGLADPCDGRLEVLLIKAPKTIIELDSIVRNVLAQDFSSPFIELLQAQEILMENPQKYDWSLDGEKVEAPDGIQISPVRGLLKLCR